MEFVAVSTVELAAGSVLELSAPQVATRRHLLKPTDDGRFVATGPVCFKAGEVFGYDGIPSKAMAEILRPVEAAAESVAAGKKGKK